MPFTFLAHQAPIVPLKMARPSWFSGTALAIGSMAPDFEYMWQSHPSGAFSHSAEGILVFCLPVTLALTWLVHRVLAEEIGGRLPDAGAFHLRDVRALARTELDATFWTKASASALVGGATHVALDGVTHPGGWASAIVPSLANTLFMAGDFPVTPAFVLQIVLTLAGIAVTILLARSIGSRRLIARWSGVDPAALDAGRSDRSSAPLVLAALGLAVGAGWVLAEGMKPGITGLCVLLVKMLFRSGALALAAMSAGCAVARRRASMPAWRSPQETRSS